MKPKYVKSPKDLQTSSKATRDGFLEQALRKTKEANPHISQARRLLKKLQHAQDPARIVDDIEIREDLVAAAGFSDKSCNYFTSAQLKNALIQVLRKIEEETGADWREEIVYRFLLTRGDSLGGTMRNITGAAAKAKFAEAVLAALAQKGISSNVSRSAKDDNRVQKISWDKRLLLFDRSPKFIKKNIDVILLNRPPMVALDEEWVSKKEKYIACGEIKGGIDPAGADEHWKTAQGALARIREKFPTKQPKLFFIGAAIEESMATEIFAQLQSGALAHAGNLTVPEQVSDLATWLVSL